MDIIAEVKTASPFDSLGDRNWDEQFQIADRVGDIISVHTDPRWEGSFDLIETAKSGTDKPILAKGMHETDEMVEEAIRRGADWVLVVGRLPGVYVEQCMVEPYTLAELADLPRDVRAVWNSRDLRTGGLKDATFQAARRLFPGWLCQASNIEKISDIDRSANAVLIGAHLAKLASDLERLDF